MIFSGLFVRELIYLCTSTYPCFENLIFAALEFPLTRSASRPTRFHLGRSQQRRLEVILWRFQVFTIL